MNDPSFSTPYEQTDFSGGFTDNYFSNDPRKCFKNDNFIIDNNKKLQQRPGSMLYSVESDILPNGVRLGRLFKYVNESYLFAQGQEKIYYLTPAAAIWQSPTSPLPLTNTGYTTDTRFSVSEWQGHLLLTDDSGALPAKIYVDDTGTVQYRTAGLPAPATPDNFVTATATASLITLANDLRTQMKAHFAGTGYVTNPHATNDVSDDALIPAAATDLTSLIALTNGMIAAYQGHYKDMTQGFVYHLPLVTDTSVYGASPAIASLGDMTLDNTLAAVTIYDVALRLNDLRTVYNQHEGASIPHGNSVGLAISTASFVYGVTQGATADLTWTPYYSWYTRFKSQYNAHLADGTGVATAHSTAPDATNNLTLGTPSTPDLFEAALEKVRLKYTAHEADAQLNAGWAFHAAKETTNHDLAIVAAATLVYVPDYQYGIRAGNFLKITAVIADIAAKFNAHSSDLGAHYTTNPNPFTNKYYVPGVNFKLAQYAYAIVYTYTYKVGNVTFKDVSTPYFFAADAQLPVEVSPITVSNIPVLTNNNTNYDVSNVKVEIYRTTDGGTVYLLANTIANGVGTYTDNLSDAELSSQAELYMTGGVVANDAPPISKCCHIVNSTGYYGSIIEDGQTLKNRIRQSVPGDFDSCPGNFFDDIDGDEVVGISSVRTIPIAFGTTGVYRIEGTFDEQGQGGMSHVAIFNPDGIGCVSENSIVRIDQGVFFAGTDGFYYTDGYQLMKVSKEWNSTYLRIVQTTLRASRITGSYDKVSKRVYWGAQLLDTSSDNDTIFCLDLEQDFPQNFCWSTWSNGTHFSPTSLINWQGRLLRGDSRGYLFQHHPDYTEDAYVNVNVSTALWGTKTIIVDYKSCASDLGMGPIRKHATWVNFNFKDNSNISLNVTSSNDDDKNAAVQLSPIKNRTHITWGSSYAMDWGVINILWNYRKSISIKRRFVSKSLRFTYKQIGLTNSFIELKASGTTPGTATVKDSDQTVTLDDATKVWPLNLEGHFIKFSADGYVAQFEVLQRVSDTVIIVDHSPQVLVNGSMAWQIWGYPKLELIRLLSYAIHAVPLSTSQQATRTES